MRVRERRRIRSWAGALFAVMLLATACTVDPVSSNGGGESAAVTEGPVRIAMITHGDAGAFWSVVRRGAEDAAGTLDVVLDYQGAAGDAKLQEQMIEAALLAGAQGLAISAPDIGAIRASLERAEQDGVPVVTLNSGASLLEEDDNSVITHVGQSEFIAGQGAGEELSKAGAKSVLCILHEQNNIGLQERCKGAKETIENAGGTLRNVQVTGKADPGSTAREIGAAVKSESPDAVLTLDPDIAQAALKPVTSADVQLATFDISPEVLQAVLAGEILFAVDQQQYLQGYLPVVFLNLALRNLNEVGAGDLVLTGPSFVTQENAADVIELAEQGTR